MNTNFYNTLLIVGFGAFDQYTRNPSGDIAREINGTTISGIKIVGLQLEVDWQDSWDQLQKAMMKYQPKAILCLGLAPEPWIRLELQARNFIKPSPDINGNIPIPKKEYKIFSNAPDRYASTLPIQWLQKKIHQKNAQTLPREKQAILDTRLSTNAGGYLCNYVFFRMMHYFQGELPFRGFIHLPAYTFPDAKYQIPDQKILLSGYFLIEQLAKWIATQTSFLV